jgi:hypothetical protein
MPEMIVIKLGTHVTTSGAKVKLEGALQPTVSWPAYFVSDTHRGLMTRFLLSDNCEFRDVGRPL